MSVLPNTREGQEIQTKLALQLLHKKKANRTREQAPPQIETEVEQAPPQGDN